MTYLKKILKSLLQLVLASGAIVLVVYGLMLFSIYCHEHNGSCEGKKGCSWCWCKYYDGSDFLHDFFF